MSAPASVGGQYVRYADGVERTLPDEDALTAEIVEKFTELQRLTFAKHRHGLRGAHAKSHGVLRGTLTVLGGLAPELAQGLFATPRDYPVIVRLSTAPGDILPDGVAAFRGLAIKVLGVGGPRLLPAPADAATQDFLLVNHPTFPTPDATHFLAALKRMVLLAHAPEEAQEALTTATRVAGGALRAVGVDAVGLIGQGLPHAHPLGATYFTQAPLRYGDHVAKLSVAPASPSLEPLRDRHLDVGDDSAIVEAVAGFFREQGAEYEVRAQLCTDLATMPVEDSSVRWDEDASPFRPVARLVIPAQEAFGPARRTYADDVLSFSPWHGVEAHRPLGSLMRVRRLGYEASSDRRHASNARPRAEPRTIDELPD